VDASGVLALQPLPVTTFRRPSGRTRLGDDVHIEGHGDGVLLSVAARIPVSHLLGLWLIEAASCGTSAWVNAVSSTQCIARDAAIRDP
jgi:hypothetical protein